MKFEKFIAIAALSALSGLSYANVYQVTPDPMIDGSLYSTNVAYSTQGQSTPFSDIFKFTIGGSGMDTVWIYYTFPQQNPLTGGNELNIDGFAVFLHDSANVLLSSDPTYGMPLAAGAYDFQVSGIADGAVGGSYQVTIATKSVPEPQTLALTLLGLGLMGGMLRRRQR